MHKQTSSRSALGAVDLALFATVVVVWGTSWLPLKLQLGIVAPEVSGVWRFAIAGAIMFVWMAASGERMRFGFADHVRFAVLGAFLFSLNFLFAYYGGFYLTSGLLAVIFSLAAVINPLLADPLALADALNDFSPQWLNSSYVLLRWLPLMPELVFGFNQAAHLKAVQWQLQPPEQVAEYAQVFSEYGALQGAFNWYRAFHFQPRDFSSTIKQPVLFLWGNRDEAFDRSAAEKTANYVEGPFRFHNLGAGHRLMTEIPNFVSNEVVSHLKTWSNISEQWKLGLVKSQPADASCVQSRPSCLSISVTPDGTGVRIRNLCNEHYQGTVQISCTGWSPEAFVEHPFNLGAKTVLVQEYNGLSFGYCYYGHRLCEVQQQ